MAKILSFYFHQGLSVLRDSCVSKDVNMDRLERIIYIVFHCHQKNGRVDLVRVFLGKSTIGLKNFLLVYMY